METNICTKCKHNKARGLVQDAMGHLCQSCYDNYQAQYLRGIAPGPVEYTGFTRENLPPNPSPEMLAQIERKVK